MATLVSGCASTPAFEAVLDIDRLEGGKHFQGTWLERPDGERLLVAYQPEADYFRFVEKRVLVRGETWEPEPYTQHVEAPHFRVTSIELAAGETPYDPIPTALPAPPMARTVGELDGRIGRWIEVHATLRSAEKHAKDDWCDAALLLDDGTAIAAEMYLTEMESEWKPHVGKRVTVLGKLARTDGRYHLIGRTAICPGETRRCGMR